jgi:hypothetical protein
VYYGEEQEE